MLAIQQVIHFDRCFIAAQESGVLPYSGLVTA
jgi:hypothetical protein